MNEQYHTNVTFVKFRIEMDKAQTNIFPHLKCKTFDDVNSVVSA